MGQVGTQAFGAQKLITFADEPSY